MRVMLFDIRLSQYLTRVTLCPDKNYPNTQRYAKSVIVLIHKSFDYCWISVGQTAMYEPIMFFDAEIRAHRAREKKIKQFFSRNTRPECTTVPE